MGGGRRRCHRVDMSLQNPPPVNHSPAWIAQVWIAFGTAVSAAALGIYHLPVDRWIRAFLAISFLMSISSAISLSKTLRDVHESTSLVSKIDEAKVNKLLTEHPVEL